MHNLFTLMKYEWKKLLQKKLVITTLFIIFTLQILSNLMFLVEVVSVSYNDSNGIIVEESMTGYEIMVAEKKNARKLHGQKVDSYLVSKIDSTPSTSQIANPYGTVSFILRKMTGKNTLEMLQYSTEELYSLWRANILQGYQDYYLTPAEIAYWEEKVDTIETPFVYQYNLGWSEICEQVLTNGVLLLILIAICLAGIFTDEHKLGTDQMILCTRNSKQVYFAKMLTGIFFGVGCALTLYAISYGFSFLFYGTEGYHATLQLEMVTSPHAITLGEATLILFGLSILAAVAESAFAMFLSEALNNSLGVMSILVGIMLLTQFLNIPEQYRLISQIWDYLPTNLITYWGFGDGRLIPILGGYLNTFQFAAFLYPALSILFMLLTYIVYKRFQVTGR